MVVGIEINLAGMSFCERNIIAEPYAPANRRLELPSFVSWDLPRQFAADPPVPGAIAELGR
jgi:hypothetical protein